MIPDDFGELKFCVNLGNGEYEEMGNSVEEAEISENETVDTENKIIESKNINKIHCMKYEDRSAMKKSLWTKNIKILFNNNWRKMHGLPLIRRRGKWEN